MWTGETIISYSPGLGFITCPVQLVGKQNIPQGMNAAIWQTQWKYLRNANGLQRNYVNNVCLITLNMYNCLFGSEIQMYFYAYSAEELPPEGHLYSERTSIPVGCLSWVQ